MIDVFANIGTGVVIGMMWMVFGIGTARLIAISNNSKFSLVHVFMWPIALSVFAARGEI